MVQSLWRPELINVAATAEAHLPSNALTASASTRLGSPVEKIEKRCLWPWPMILTFNHRQAVAMTNGPTRRNRAVDRAWQYNYCDELHQLSVWAWGYCWCWPMTVQFITPFLISVDNTFRWSIIRYAVAKYSLSPEFRTRFQREVLLFLEIPEFPSNTV